MRTLSLKNSVTTGQSFDQTVANRSARQALLLMMDEATDGMTLIAPRGVIIHRNPSLLRITSIPSFANNLFAAVEYLAAQVRSTEYSRSNETRLVSNHDGCTLRGCLLPTMESVPFGTVLVTVYGLSNLLASGDIMREFRLTRRQAEIAGLLAARLSDIEIAERLGISWHTVRSHVDRVFGALRVHSRAEIVHRLTSRE